MDWKSALIEIGGAIAAPYTGGYSAVIANGIVAARANNAAKNTLTDQASKDATISQTARDTNVARLQPGANIGNSALRTLAGLYGLPDPGGMSAPAAETPEASAAMTNPLSMRDLATGIANRPGTLADFAGAVRSGSYTGAPDVSPQSVAQQQTQSSYGTRTLQAPDGSIEQVPEGLVPHYLKLGAKEVPMQAQGQA
jgi:hypothetical protein